MPRKPKPLSPAERLKSANQAKTLRRTAKMRALNLVPRQVWGHKDAWTEIMERVREINGRYE